MPRKLGGSLGGSQVLGSVLGDFAAGWTIAVPQLPCSVTCTPSNSLFVSLS